MTVVVYIVHLWSLPLYWEPYCGLCGWYHDLCGHFYTAFASLSDGIAELRFGDNWSWCLKWHLRLIPEKAKSMVVSRSRTYSCSYGDLTVGGAELEKVKSRRILGVTLDFKLTFRLIFVKLCQRHTRVRVSYVEQESYLTVHIWWRAVPMNMFCIVSWCECRRRSPIWVS